MSRKFTLKENLQKNKPYIKRKFTLKKSYFVKKLQKIGLEMLR